MQGGRGAEECASVSTYPLLLLFVTIYMLNVNVALVYILNSYDYDLVLYSGFVYIILSTRCFMQFLE